MKSDKKRISQIITIWLVIIVVVACVTSAVLTYISLAGRSEEQTMSLLKQNVEDVSTDIDELADDALISYIDRLMRLEDIYTADVEDPMALSRELTEFCSSYNSIEVNIVGSDGIIVASSKPEYIGYDMHDGEQASEFLVLLDGETESYIQDMRAVSYDESLRMKYAGKRFPDGSGFLELGLTNRPYYNEISRHGKYATTNRRIGKSGYLLICGMDQSIINSYHNEHTGKAVADAGISIDPEREYVYENMKCDVFGVPSFVNINKVKGIFVIGVYSVDEAVTNVNTMVKASVLLETFVFTILFVTLMILLRNLVVNNMVKVNDALAQITEGNLDEKVDVRDTYEFDVLSNDINATVDRLKELIAQARARIDAELALAKDIQSSALPGVFPPFPERKEFELFACMDAAKEVGGDFYDFYMIGNKLAFLIADVSGKSIPGAMFMMKAKEVIKSNAESGLSPEEIFTKTNRELCEGNEAEMFITAWMGFLEPETGTVTVANAGHNPPVLIRDGAAEFLNLRPGFMLAGMNGIVYRQQTLKMKKGDILFLYTDGVTEAMDAEENLYGNDRLIERLSFGENYPEPTDENGIAKAICTLVTEDIRDFVQGAEQSDDTTMLCLRFLGKS